MNHNNLFSEENRKTHNAKDCKQSLFFLSFSEGRALAPERRAANALCGHFRVSRVSLDGGTEKKERLLVVYPGGNT